MRLPESARVVERTRKTWKIEMSQMSAEVGESTVGCAWTSVLMMSRMLMLGVEQVLMVKQCQRNALRKISSDANGHWMIVIRPR